MITFPQLFISVSIKIILNERMLNQQRSDGDIPFVFEVVGYLLLICWIAWIR